MPMVRDFFRVIFMQYFISGDKKIEFVVTEDITKDFGLHNHTEHYVISFIVKGEATLFYNNVSVVLKKDDTFIIRPYIPHSVKVEADSQILSLCINKDLFSAQSANEISQTVSTKFDEISAENGFESRIKSELTDAIGLITETIGDECYKLSADIQKVADKIAEKSSEIYSLDQLSEDVYTSKYHLIRKFKSKIGLTPHQFMIQVRVRNAQKELADGGRLIDAAIDNGFYDSSHFDRCFEKIVGISPSEYQRKSRGI